MGVDGVDGAIRPMTMALSASHAILAVVTLGLVVILVMVSVVTAVLIVTAAVIIAAFVVSGTGSPFGFFDIGISICYLYQFADGCGPLMV